MEFCWSTSSAAASASAFSFRRSSRSSSLIRFVSAARVDGFGAPTPPYLHDGRLLTLEDTIEFFNLIVQAHLTDDEMKDLLAFLLAL
jgi:cytochrome c peroxidase